jgi:hypothetical protein
MSRVNSSNIVYRVRRPGCESLLFLREGQLKGGDTAIGSTDTAQIVEVNLWGNRSYAYVWDGDGQLEIGDRVVVPGPTWRRNPTPVQSVGTVVQIGSKYPGPLEAVTERFTE